jgi:lipopolysaccharide transport system permease protein
MSTSNEHTGDSSTPPDHESLTAEHGGARGADNVPPVAQTDRAWVIRTARREHISFATRWATAVPLLRIYARRRVRLRYRQSALGFTWAIAQPVAIVAIYWLVFTQFLSIDDGDLPYLSMAWSGLTVWSFTQAAVQASTTSFLEDAYLLGRVSFPREVIPLAPVAAGLVDLALATAILVVIAVAQGASIGPTVAFIPILGVILVVWVAAICIIVATLTVFLRDLAPVVALSLRLAFIATPVMYPSSLVPDNLAWILNINPFAVLIDALRDVLLVGVWPDFGLVAAHALAGTALLGVGFWYLRAVERRIVDVI